MKRTLALVLTALALVLGAPAAQATTDGWCLVPGSDICRRYVNTDGWCSDVSVQDVPHAISIEDQLLGQGPCM